MYPHLVRVSSHTIALPNLTTGKKECTHACTLLSPSNTGRKVEFRYENIKVEVGVVKARRE